jgi:hypothetical protein
MYRPTIGTPGVLEIPPASVVDDIQAPPGASEVWLASDSILWGFAIKWQSATVPIALGVGAGLALPGSGWCPLPQDGCSRRLLRIENQSAAAVVVLLIWR